MPKVLALRVDPYDIPADADNPRGAKGNSFWFVSANDDPGQNDGSGHKPMKIGVSDALYPSIKGKLPAICDIEFDMKSGAGNKATVTLTSIQFLSSVNIKQMLGNKPA